MALEKIGPNQWKIKVSVRVQGRDNPVKKRVTFEGTKTEAEARKAEIIKEIRSNATRSLTAPQKTIKNFSGLLSIFKEKRGPFSPSHERKVNFLDRELGHVFINAFPDVFENYLRELKNSCPKNRKGKKTRSNATVNRLTEIARAAFGLAVELRYLPENPITKARFPKLEEKPRDRYLSEDERLKLLNAITKHRPYILPIIQYMLLVPCRKTELTSAKREQYNPFTGTIYIPDSKADIPIYKPVPSEMKQYFDSIPSDCPYLFYWKDKKGYHALGTLQKPWAYCLKKAELTNVRIHDLRHISASDLYHAGNPERTIMDIAGWKTPMLSTYRHKDSFKSAQSIQFSKPTHAASEEKTIPFAVNSR
jgi:integrase